MPSRIVAVLKEKESVVEENRSLIRQLADPKLAEQAYEALAKRIGPDDMAMLACQLEAAVLCCDRLAGLGVPETVQVETMKCFSRFLAETKEMTGLDKFDREWWTWRQTSGLLLRIGQLEYEMLPEGTLSLHIPTDAVFTPEQVDASLTEAKAFFRSFFPDYGEAEVVCHSWLLSPKLRRLLGETSNILHFQNRFVISDAEFESKDYIGWLFRMPSDTAVEDLPEKTSLQRKTKELIRSSIHLGTGRGTMGTI
jgi:hypothetical protein